MELTFSREEMGIRWKNARERTTRKAPNTICFVMFWEVARARLPVFHENGTFYAKIVDLT